MEGRRCHHQDCKAWAQAAEEVRVIDFRAAYATTQPDLLPADPAVAQMIRDVLKLKQWRDKADARYLQQLRDWQALADVRHTPEQLDAIRADHARRIRNMGNK